MDAARELIKHFPYGSLQDAEKFFCSLETPRVSDCIVYATKLLKEYPYATLKDVEKFIITSDNFKVIDKVIQSVSITRETEELKGREHVEAGPLLHVHSVHVQPKEALQNRPLVVFGTIRVKYQNIRSGEVMQLDVYSRSADGGDCIGPSGGDLTLGWPDTFCNHQDLWMGLHGTTVGVDLYLKIEDKVVPFAQEEILVEDSTECDFEEVRSKEFQCALCSATLVYIAMPFAALCQVHVGFSGKDKSRLVDVAGKIVARYKITYGNYDSEACVLFEKQNDFEPVRMKNYLSLSRTWLGLPAYSSLEIDLDLRDFNTNRNLVRKRVRLFHENGSYAGEYAEAVDDLAIIIDARLFPYPHDGRNGCDDSDKGESNNELSSSNNGNPWCHGHGQQSIPQPSKLAEFYSIFIGRKKLVALNIVGTVEFSSNDNTQNLFKRKTGYDAMKVEDSQKLLPLSDVYSSFVENTSLELKVDLEDLDDEFKNRGFATYKLGFMNHNSSYNTQICSVFPGKDGFCALHYSLFPRACEASIEIFLRIKSSQAQDGKIYGSAIAQYSNFDYSTKFKRDNFRSVLFKRADKDPVQLGSDGRVPLSRCAVVVPMDSSLIIEVDFCSLSVKDHLTFTEKFKIGCCCFRTETNDYELGIRFTWSDGLHDGWRDLDEDKDCMKGGVIQTKRSIKRKQPDSHGGGSDLDDDEEYFRSDFGPTPTPMDMSP
ncbi:unnamed protein product [Cuscuta campestris]|uniref:DUF6598 domain-containing protein n=1 Tax=Cuscuta campestris TaxID=132261 RepID=A0A484L1J0_9ASTE|nr:unnamed protein product [Cuscuta campestris]